MTIAGAPACTVFCDVPDPDLVVATLREHLPVGDVGPGWERLVSDSPAGSMAVTRLMFAPGTKFSSVVLGTLTAVRAGTETRSGARDDVVRRLQTCDMMLGVRFDPALGADDARHAAVLAVAAATGALVLAGDAVHDAEGEPLVTVA